MAKTEVLSGGHVQASASTTAPVDRNNNTDDENNNNNDSAGKPHLHSMGSPLKAPNGKYQLRPRSLQARRFCDDWSFHDSLRDKPRQQPLSRYRRKTANARERYRMRQINTAFESLRGVLPSWVCSRKAASDLTKITTLRLASAYIRALQDILEGNASEESCPWVFSSILNDGSGSGGSAKGRRKSCGGGGVSKGNPGEDVGSEDDLLKKSSPLTLGPQATSTDADFVSLLCGGNGTDATTLDDDGFDTFAHLSPIGDDSDPVTLLLLGSDSTSRCCWGANEGQQVPLVT
ncbi:helix-loop-helix protein delilah-like [Macrobrachium nipponense]|uniref:helix-loop-helix protein delilah-like n=1 Tax=Macrobrachium nipponense TaxID=159736 RepID=UPI0030C7DC49